MKGDNATGSRSGRSRIFSIVIILVVGLLLGRLVQLQIVNASEYSGESRMNSVRENRVLAARGSILDRTGRVLVDNQPAYSVTVIPRYFDPSMQDELAAVLEMPPEVLAERMEQASSFSSYQPSPILNLVPFDRLSRMLERIDEFPGVDYHATQTRRYMAPLRASHALGYVREITDADLARMKELGYRPGDRMGQRGVERVYEQDLRGRLGSEFRLVNVHGQDVSRFQSGAEDIEPIPGADLVTTLDAGLQALAESLFVGKRGSVVALDPRNGEILAMVSMPDYDLSQFTRQITVERWEALSAGEGQPLFNRATQSAQMPGSTWKPIIGLIALETGVITPTETFNCPGYHPVGRGRFFRCLHVHGQVNVMEAIEVSCNTFFFEMMRRIDVNSFARHARNFGFGQRIETDVTEQDTGLIPDSSYYNRTYGRWTVGYQMNIGVGQGELKVTPLQLARYVAAVGVGGTLYKPHLVRAAVDPATGQPQPVNEPEGESVGINQQYVELVREAMRRVMVYGTGRSLQIPGDIESGGKTGTAQNPRGKDDSVFIMFAPYENPTIAIAAVVENAGYGGTAAGPIASLMAERYLTGAITRSYLYDRMLQLKSDPLPDAAE